MVTITVNDPPYGLAWVNVPRQVRIINFQKSYKMPKAIHFTQAIEIECPTFDKDGKPTGNKETRVQARFASTFMGIRSVGSAILESGVKLTDVEFDTETDYSSVLMFVSQDNGYMKVVPK